jgi:hypothetical protein
MWAPALSAMLALRLRGADLASLGHTLVFLPGAAEIRRTMRECEAVVQRAGPLVFPLHGDLSPEEQDRAVSLSPQRKLILATNVVESSVTVEGVTAVINNCEEFLSLSGLTFCGEKAKVRTCTIPNCGTSRRLRYCEMAKKESEKKALNAIDKAVKKAIKSGISGGLVDQTVAASIHAATVKAARKAEAVKAEKTNPLKKTAKAVKKTEQDVD